MLFEQFLVPSNPFLNMDFNQSQFNKCVSRVLHEIVSLNTVIFTTVSEPRNDIKKPFRQYRYKNIHSQKQTIKCAFKHTMPNTNPKNNVSADYL